MKTTTIRLDDEVVTRLELIARVEGRSVADEIREAVALLLERKRESGAVVKGITELIRQDQEVLEDFLKEFQPQAL